MYVLIDFSYIKAIRTDSEFYVDCEYVLCIENGRNFV